MKPTPGRCIFRPEYHMLIIQFNEDRSIQHILQRGASITLCLRGLAIKYNTYQTWELLDQTTTKII